MQTIILKKKKTAKEKTFHVSSQPWPTFLSLGYDGQFFWLSGLLVVNKAPKLVSLEMSPLKTVNYFMQDFLL